MTTPVKRNYDSFSQQLKSVDLTLNKMDKRGNVKEVVTITLKDYVDSTNSKFTALRLRLKTGIWLSSTKLKDLMKPTDDAKYSEIKTAAQEIINSTPNNKKLLSLANKVNELLLANTKTPEEEKFATIKKKIQADDFFKFDKDNNEVNKNIKKDFIKEIEEKIASNDEAYFNKYPSIVKNKKSIAYVKDLISKLGVDKTGKIFKGRLDEAVNELMTETTPGKEKAEGKGKIISDLETTRRELNQLYIEYQVRKKMEIEDSTKLPKAGTGPRE